MSVVTNASAGTDLLSDSNSRAAPGKPLELLVPCQDPSAPRLSGLPLPPSAGAPPLFPGYAARGASVLPRIATSPPPMTNAMPRTTNNVGDRCQMAQSINAVKTIVV